MVAETSLNRWPTTIWRVRSVRNQASYTRRSCCVATPSACRASSASSRRTPAVPSPARSADAVRSFRRTDRSASRTTCSRTRRSIVCFVGTTKWDVVTILSTISPRTRCDMMARRRCQCVCDPRTDVSVTLDSCCRYHLRLGHCRRRVRLITWRPFWILFRQD